MTAVVAVARTFAVPAARDILTRLTTMRLALVVCIVLSGGILASIATTSDPLWWHLHFSRLGTFHDASGALFNGTLIVSGALVVLFADRVRRDLARLGRRASRRGSAVSAQVFLTTIGANLSMVGLVPLNTNKTLHDNVAAGMVLGFAALLLTSPVLMHRMPRRLVLTTAVIFVFLFCGAWLFVTETINLALFEVIAFGAMFAWSGVFTRCLAIRATPAPASEGPQPVSAPRPVAASDESHPAHPARRIPHRPALVRSARRPARRPLARPDVPAAAHGPLPRGCTASGAPGASGTWTTPVRR